MTVTSPVSELQFVRFFTVRMSNSFWLDLDDFHVSETCGFLLEDPLDTLPDYFQAWNILAKEMQHLVQDKQLRDKVDQMELLDHKLLEGYRQKMLAHLQLCIIGTGYIWQNGDDGVPTKLPPCLAVPWWEVSQTLGIQPVLSYPSFVLANWHVIDPEQPVCPKNLQCFYELPGGREAGWFVIVSAQIEYDFGQGIKELVDALKHAHSGNEESLAESLNNIIITIGKMKESFSKMHDGLTADTFYNTMRPFLSGWGGEDSPLPDGIIFEGINEHPIKMTGGSAAQSSTMQMVDAVLGIEHSADKVEFLQQMRNYMPPDHRRLIETIETHTAVKELVVSSKNEKLTSAYNRCVAAVVDFRSYHIQIVAKYIVVMAGKKTGKHDYESVSNKGTGGSSLIPFLQSIRSTTSGAAISRDS